MKMEMRKAVALLISTAVLMLITSIDVDAQGIEKVEIAVRIAPELFNSLIVFAIPINVSDPAIFTLQSTYVTMSNLPKLSFAFSAVPPIIIFAEPYAVDGAVYEVQYGGANPYTQFISLPGTNASFWYAFDEFDFPTDIWLYRYVSIAASKATISGGGFIALKYAYPSESTALWLLSGRRALLFIFSTAVDRFTTYTLTPYNFTDFNLVRDGNDIYFMNHYGICIPYTVIYLSKSEGLLTVSFNPMNNTVIYMMYGGDNPCTDTRIQL